MEKEIDASWTEAELQEEKERVEKAYLESREKHLEIEDYAKMLKRRTLKLDDEIAELKKLEPCLTDEYIEFIRDKGLRALDFESTRNMLLIGTVLTFGIALVTNPIILIAAVAAGLASVLVASKHREYVIEVIDAYNKQKKAIAYGIHDSEDLRALIAEKETERAALCNDYSELRRYAGELLQINRDYDFRKREIEYEEQLRAEGSLKPFPKQKSLNL